MDQFAQKSGNIQESCMDMKDTRFSSTKSLEGSQKLKKYQKSLNFFQWSQMSPFLMPTIFFLIKKFQSCFLKLNKLDFLIFGNVEIWRPIQAEGRKN